MKTKLQSIKNKLIIQRFMVSSMALCFLMAAVILGVTKISGDYMALEETNGPEQNSVRVATDGAITTTTPGAVTVTPTVTTTPTPTIDPRTQVTFKLYYDKEIMEVTSTKSTSFYISQDKEKSWELLQNPKDIELSIFMKSSDNTIYIKGNLDERSVAVKIPKPDNNLKVNYVVENGESKLVFTDTVSKQVRTTAGLQFRKGNDGTWDKFSQIILSKYEFNGYTLQFRVAPTESTRAGKIVTVKIPKRQSPPSIKEDYSKFTLSGMKVGVTYYRVNGVGNFIPFNPADTKKKTLDLTELLLPGIPPNRDAIPPATIEFYNAGNAKKVASGVRVIRTLAQPIAPLKSNVKLINNLLSIADASKNKPYEYMVLHNGEVVNLQTAKWKKVTSSKEIKITKVGTAIPMNGDFVYFRLASTKDAKTKEVTPASMYDSIAFTSVTITK